MRKGTKMPWKERTEGADASPRSPVEPWTAPYCIAIELKWEPGGGPRLGGPKQENIAGRKFLLQGWGLPHKMARPHAASGNC